MDWELMELKANLTVPKVPRPKFPLTLKALVWGWRSKPSAAMQSTRPADWAGQYFNYFDLSNFF